MTAVVSTLGLSACGSSSKTGTATSTTRAKNSASQTIPAGQFGVDKGPIYQLLPTNVDTAIAFLLPSDYSKGAIGGSQDAKEIGGSRPKVNVKLTLQYHVDFGNPDTMWVEKGSTVSISDPRVFGGQYTTTSDSAFKQGRGPNGFVMTGTLAAAPRNLNIQLVLKPLICPENKIYRTNDCHL